MLTGGNVANCTAGAALLDRLPACDILHADKGYDANAIRRQVEDRGAMPNCPLRFTPDPGSGLTPPMAGNRPPWLIGTGSKPTSRSSE